MLSFFPELLFLSPLAALVIRLTLAGLFAHDAWQRLYSPEKNIMSIVSSLAVSICFCIGLWTQLIALLTALTLIVSLFVPRMRLHYPSSTLFLASIMALTLLLTGAGPFAFDLPL